MKPRMRTDLKAASAFFLLWFVVVLLWWLFGGAVWGAEPRVWKHPAAGEHDPYSELRSPEGVKCCGGKDCMPREVRWNSQTNTTEAYIQEIKDWVVVDLDRVIGPPPAGTPIGTIVICWYRTVLPGRVEPIWQRCVLMGGGV